MKFRLLIILAAFVLTACDSVKTPSVTATPNFERTLAAPSWNDKRACSWCPATPTP